MVAGNIDPSASAAVAAAAEVAVDSWIVSLLGLRVLGIFPILFFLRHSPLQEHSFVASGQYPL